MILREHLLERVATYMGAENAIIIPKNLLYLYHVLKTYRTGRYVITKMCTCKFEYHQFCGYDHKTMWFKKGMDYGTSMIKQLPHVKLVSNYQRNLLLAKLFENQQYQIAYITKKPTFYENVYDRNQYKQYQKYVYYYQSKDKIVYLERPRYIRGQKIKGAPISRWVTFSLIPIGDEQYCIAMKIKGSDLTVYLLRNDIVHFFDKDLNGLMFGRYNFQYDIHSKLYPLIVQQYHDLLQTDIQKPNRAVLSGI